MSALRHLVTLLVLLAASWLAPGPAEAHPSHGAAPPAVARPASPAARLADPATMAPAQAAHCAGTCCGLGACGAPALAAETGSAGPAPAPQAVRQPDRHAPAGRTVETRLRPPRAQG